MTEENCTSMEEALSTILRHRGEKHLREYLEEPAKLECRVLDPDFDRIARKLCPSLPPLRLS